MFNILMYMMFSMFSILAEEYNATQLKVAKVVNIVAQIPCHRSYFTSHAHTTDSVFTSKSDNISAKQ